MRTTIASTIIAMTLAVGPNTAVARDGFVGSYATECLPEVTCYAEVTAAGPGAYTLVWEAAGRTTGAPYCREEVDLVTSAFERVPGETYDSVPNGRHRTGARVMALDIDPTQLHLWADRWPCSAIPGVRGTVGLTGMYYAYGD